MNEIQALRPEGKGSMKKKIAIIVLAVLILLGILAGVAMKLQNDWVDETYIVIDEVQIRRDVTELDYSGKGVAELEKLEELTALEKLDLRNTGLTVERYERLCDVLPQCQILWSVPFQGGYLDMDAETIAVTSLSEADVAQLKYLEELQTVNAAGCRDYEVLTALKEARPDLAVSYTVQIGGTEYADTIEELAIENADPAEVSVALQYLEQLTAVTFTGTAPDNEQIYQWMCAYPGIQFVWDFEVCGVSTNSLATELILSEIPVESVEEVESSLKYFYNLQKVEMCNCGIPSEEMDALWKRHPETRFVWTVQVGVCNLRTDITYFMPYQYGYDGYSVLKDRHMGEMKYCVDLICMDLGHMEISDYSFLSYMPNMQYLILADTQGDDFSVLAELKELKYLELFMTTFDQAEVLTGLTKLEDLNLGNSKIDNIEPLKQMTWLKHLWMPATKKVSGTEKKELVAALPDTVINYQGAGSTGNGWREIPNYYAMRDLMNMSYMAGK